MKKKIFTSSERLEKFQPNFKEILISLIIILKIPKNQGFTLSLKNEIFEKPLEGVLLTPPVFLELKLKLAVIKDTYREKAPSKKIPVLTESTNMGIWVVGTSN